MSHRSRSHNLTRVVRLYRFVLVMNKGFRAVS
jgi:hypothetical protein